MRKISHSRSRLRMSEADTRCCYMDALLVGHAFARFEREKRRSTKSENESTSFSTITQTQKHKHIPVQTTPCLLSPHSMLPHTPQCVGRMNVHTHH